jgi:hypothetical protein
MLFPNCSFNILFGKNSFFMKNQNFKNAQKPHFLVFFVWFFCVFLCFFGGWFLLPTLGSDEFLKLNGVDIERRGLVRFLF